MTARKRYRETRYPEGLRVPVETAMKEALDAEADAAETSLSAVVRDAIARGLPLVRDARRKKARQSARQSARHGAAK